MGRTAEVVLVVHLDICVWADAAILRHVALEHINPTMEIIHVLHVLVVLIILLKRRCHAHCVMRVTLVVTLHYPLSLVVLVILALLVLKVVPHAQLGVITVNQCNLLA